MTIAESVVKLGLGKDKFGSSKSEERGVREKDHKEDNDDGNGNGNNENGGNGKLRVGRKKPKRERDKLKCFLCDGPHMLKNCLKKFALKKKSVAVVKGKVTSELGESSKGLPPKKEGSLSSNLEEEVVMKIVKLELMRLKSSESSELTESSTRLSPMRKVGDASDFKGKEAMQVGQLTQVNAKWPGDYGQREVECCKSRGFCSSQVRMWARWFELRSNVSQGRSLEGRRKLRHQDETKRIKSVPFGSHNEDVMRMGGGE
ncbi:hypothetical protein PVK06_027789 [Gossypium arboreum]|uniref:Uncharacterized protein n=1 Tax=Gossypium arboreum TaxID=29729 RepID=A0ABR0P177_GOSAR|nr:hypothetical protein PVK06_027789 [Gossypium arboreum]